MSRFTPELEELVDLFCEGNMPVEQARRLEALVGESAVARDYLLDSFQVHCELAWQFRRESADLSQPPPVDDRPLPVSSAPARGQLRRWTFAAVAVALLVAVTLGLAGVFRSGRPEERGAPLPSSSVARIEQTNSVRWRQEQAPALNAPLPVGSKLAIQQGLVEVHFDGGARMIAQGPAEFELQSPSSAALLAGSLTAEVPANARGFTIHTPSCTVVDLGTRFAVACQPGETEVEVFSGHVLLRLEGTRSEGGPQEETVLANSAVRVSGAPGNGSLLKVEPIAAGSRHFVQSMTGSAALLQALVASDPRVIHFYPFAGATNVERLRDRRGDLDLCEVVMRDGNGGGRLEFTRSGPDPAMQVVAAFRGKPLGVTHGRGLQSKAVFQPPAAMTVELLLQFSSSDESSEGFVASAVTLRHSRDDCGFLVAAIGGGELACLLEGDAEWLRSGFKFVPGRWYYVASTFRARNTETEVNAYVADLSDQSPTLSWVVKDRIALGVAASGLLGIGKGFDGEMASAYPWAGQLAHVAIYDTLLERQTLEDHLKGLTSHAANRPESAPSK